MRLDRKSERILVAAMQAGQQVLASILSGCDADFAATFEEGMQQLKLHRYSHVVVGYFFAESHMFEFAQAVRELQPQAKVLCVKGAGRPLDDAARRGLDYALRSLGCEAFIDLTGGEIPETALPIFNDILRRCRAKAATL
jgi:hypothetical protein